MCHELRNPIHVLKSTLAMLLDDVQMPTTLSYPLLRHQSSLSTVHLTADTSARSPALQVWHSPIANSPCSPDQLNQRREMVADVLAALDRMEATVNDVLDFRKLDANMFKMNLLPELLAPLVDRACRHCRSFLKSSVQFGYRVTPRDAVVMVDKRRLFQILVNGLSNAGKFTADDGVVVVDATVLTEAQGRQYLVLTVGNSSNRGIGDAESLFVPFRGTTGGTAPSSAG